MAIDAQRLTVVLKSLIGPTRKTSGSMRKISCPVWFLERMAMYHEIANASNLLLSVCASTSNGQNQDTWKWLWPHKLQWSLGRSQPRLFCLSREAPKRRVRRTSWHVRVPKPGLRPVGARVMSENWPTELNHVKYQHLRRLPWGRQKEKMSNAEDKVEAWHNCLLCKMLHKIYKGGMQNVASERIRKEMGSSAFLCDRWCVTKDVQNIATGSRKRRRWTRKETHRKK